MPTVKEIRDAIKAKIAGVPNVGVVHGYERYAKEPSKFIAFYKDAASSRILGWHVRRVSTREVFIDTGRWEIFHGWRVRGYMGIDDVDATEETFDTLIEAIRDAFRDDPTLGGLIFEMINPQNGESGLQVVEHNPVLLAGVLCHKGELALVTQHLYP